jgi:tryptophan-rich sensory protein
VKRRMTELRLPPYSPPFAGWIGIALVYYAACFVVLYRLFANHARSSAGTSALVLIVTIMGINAAWNYLFFRQRDVRASFWVSVPYAMLAVVLVALLFRTDYVAAWAFLPYVVYLGMRRGGATLCGGSTIQKEPPSTRVEWSTAPSHPLDTIT